MFWIVAGSTLICGGRSPEEERVDNQHEQCPDILKRDSCHCHNVSSAGSVRIGVFNVQTSIGFGGKFTN